MKSLKRFFTRLANLAARRRHDQRLKEEVEEHLALQTEEYVRAGLPPAEAHRQAILKFGPVEAVREEHFAEVRLAFIETLLQDLRFALRMLAKSPGFTAVTTLTLALGIGANTAIFSVIDAVMIRALPVENPQQLVLFTWTSNHQIKYRGSSYGDCDAPNPDCTFSMPFFRDMRAQANAFSGVAASAGPLDVNFTGNGPASIAKGEFVSGDFFSTLGLKTVLGRPLGLQDESPTAPAAIVLNYAYWQRAFGADPSAVGRIVSLNNRQVAIVGVADPRFMHLTPGKTEDFFMPFSLVDRVHGEWGGDHDRLNEPATFWINIVGRLKPGVTMGQAQAAVSTIFRNHVLRGAKPLSTEADNPAIRLLPARQGLNGDTVEYMPMLNLIMVAVGFVLLIACANVTGLILARSARREKEMATRQALGASRARIARQLLTESIVLSLAGGALGVLVAFAGVRALVTLMSNGPADEFGYAIAPDWRVLAFTTAVTLTTGILSGLAPTLLGARVDLTPSLRQNASSPPGASRAGQRFPLGNVLVVVQVALSIVVLAGAGLLVRTLSNLHHINPGFDTQNILLFGINPKIAGYTDAQTVQFYSNLQQRLAALPGVISASYSEYALLSMSTSGSDVHLDGAAPKSNVNTDTLTVGPDFFSTMHIPMLGGRVFTSADFASAVQTHAAIAAAQKAPGKPASPGPAGPTSLASASSARPSTSPPAPTPVMINQAFAQRFFPNRNPVGLHMGNAQEDEPAKGPQPGFLIVGIVGDTKYGSLLRDVRPMMFLPLVGNSAHFELRTAADPSALVKLVRGAVSAADNNLPLFNVRTQTEQIEGTLSQQRLLSNLSSFFALLALLLACIGLYGLLSYDVAQRTRELGIRMALGAQKRGVMHLVLRQGFLLVLVGVAVGIAAAIGVTRFMNSMLYKVHTTDPVTFAGVAILLSLVALVACTIPARRAMRVDPIVALRCE
jgi:predicted permease